MHSIIKDKKGVFAVKFSGKIEKEDYEDLIPILEERIDQYGRLNMYWEMEEIEGWEFKGIMDDLRFDIRHTADFAKVAIVGNQKWQDFMTQLMKPFTKAEVRYFDVKAKEQARNWIGESVIV